MRFSTQFVLLALAAGLAAWATVSRFTAAPEIEEPAKSLSEPELDAWFI